MHAPSQFLLDGLELRPHSIAPGFPHNEELALTCALTDEGEAQDVEGLRLAEPAPSTSIRRKAAEFDQAGLVRMERQRELLSSIPRACGSPPAIPGAIPRPPRARSSFRGRRGRRAGRCHQRAFASPFNLHTKARYFNTF